MVVLLPEEVEVLGGYILLSFLTVSVGLFMSIGGLKLRGWLSIS